MIRGIRWILYHYTIIMSMSYAILLSTLFEYYYVRKNKTNVDLNQLTSLRNTGMVYAFLTNISIQ